MAASARTFQIIRFRNMRASASKTAGIGSRDPIIVTVGAGSIDNRYMRGKNGR